MPFFVHAFAYVWGEVLLYIYFRVIVFTVFYDVADGDVVFWFFLEVVFVVVVMESVVVSVS